MAKGPVILLTHGYFRRYRRWRGQIAPLSKGHKLVLWDMRGHGLEATRREDQIAMAARRRPSPSMAALLDTAECETGDRRRAFARQVDVRSAFERDPSGPGAGNSSSSTQAPATRKTSRARDERQRAQDGGRIQRRTGSKACNRRRRPADVATAPRQGPHGPCARRPRDAHAEECAGDHLAAPSHQGRRRSLVVGEKDTPFLAAKRLWPAEDHA